MGSSAIVSIEYALQTQWDVIIIGSGMGGCAAAYQLAKHNKKVLILEKGLANFTQHQGVEAAQDDPEERLQSGKWPEQLTAVIDKRRSEVWAPLGCGAGGSSSLYAAALQRLEPGDFDEQVLPNGETISWPYDYKHLAPYYEQAEKLFSVCGTNDPLNSFKSQSLLPPPAMCDADRHFFSAFQARGLHPFRLHVGIKYKPACMECGGHICQKSCKQDANNACLQPALESGNVYFLERAEVSRLEADSSRITAVDLTINDNHYSLSASVFVLAAGAYFSPVLLQKSSNQHWPDGLANRSGMVGRNLMFHAGHHIAFWTKEKCSREGANKTLALRDYYEQDGKKYGEFQSTGLSASYGNIVYALGMLFDQSLFRHIKILKQFLRIPAFIATRLYGDATIFATIVEDYPYEENRVIADGTAKSGMRFEYNRHQELLERAVGFKKMICKQLKPLKSVPIGGMHLNYGHPCGTCRIGTDPNKSVFNGNGQAHDLSNLYIADAAFMPTSGGTNPSLTVAAHALRVADKIALHLASKDA